MMFRVTLILGLLIALPQQSSARLQDLICDDSARIEEQLERVVGARREGQGIRDPEALIQIWIVPRNGDWTIVQSYANGTSCIVAMGEHWQVAVPNPA